MMMGGSRTRLKPGDLVMVDPVKPGVNPAAVLVAENGTDLFFQFSPRPWHETAPAGVKGLTVAEAEEVLRGEREYPQVLYKVWDEESQSSYAPPQSVLDEVERRQMSVEPARGSDPEVQDKIPPAPIDFDRPSSGLW